MKLGVNFVLPLRGLSLTAGEIYLNQTWFSLVKTSQTHIITIYSILRELFNKTTKITLLTAEFWIL